MANELQTANIWKRAAAWLFDSFLLLVLVVAFGMILSALTGYDNYSRTMDSAYETYGSAYGVNFEMTRAEYDALTQGERENYQAAYDALIADENAMYAYNMMLALSLVIISLGVFLGVTVWEFLIPLWLGNGQTLGKKIFGLCLVRNDGVRLNTMQLFTRSILGKFSIETMIPVLIALMIFWGTMGVMGTVVILTLTIGQVFSVLVTRSHCAIHDLLAGTVVVDYASQTIFATTEDLIAYQKKVAADRAARAPY